MSGRTIESQNLWDRQVLFSYSALLSRYCKLLDLAQSCSLFDKYIVNPINL